MSKIIARLFGGLGNQLFIYATARAISERTGAELVLDTKTGFRGDVYERTFALQHFNVRYREASKLERFDFPTGSGWRYLFRKVNYYLPFQRRFYLTDLLAQEWFFIPQLTSYQPTFRSWLEGYWQSPLYFEDIKSILLKELYISSDNLSPETKRIAREIVGSNGVCVHMRLLRNFIKGEEVGTGPTVTSEHFQKSVDYMAQRLDNPHFFCFSDNPGAMSSIFKTTCPVTFIAHNDGETQMHEDIYLMSLCRHSILSNSTFGWWPAWLSDTPESIIIAPSKSFWDNRDILPEHWITSDLIPE